MLGLQIHFVSTGKPEKAKVSVALRYPREVITKQLRCMQIFDTRFAIPPGAPAHKVSGQRAARARRDRRGAVLPHAPARQGHDLHGPPARRAQPETLLIIPNYNFAWQIPYRWEPGKKLIPKGTRLECVAHFDNSPFNPFNPNPEGDRAERPADAPGDDVRLLLLHPRRRETRHQGRSEDGMVRKPAGGKP